MCCRLPSLCWAAVVGAVLAAPGNPGYGQDSPAVRGVRTAHESLLQWLGNGEYGKGWKAYLMADQLTEQLKRGRKADRKAVKEIADKYASGTPGLSLANFAAVRDALQTWQAELALPTIEELPKALRDAKAEFKPPKEADVAAAKSATQSALAALEAFVGPSSGWRSVLRLDDLQAQLKAAKPDLEILADVLRRFSRDYRGLEMTQFASVKDALARYLAKSRISQDKDAEANFKKQLDQLADSLTAFGNGRKAADLEKAALAIRWLEERDQLPRLTKIAREAYWKPNVLLDMAADVVVYGFGYNVDDTDAIDEYRNEAQVRGESRTQGKTKAKLKPYDHVAVIHNEFRGTASSRTTAYASRATVYSRGTTTIHAITQIGLDRHGLRDYPTTAAADTTSYTENIDSAYQSQASQRVEENRPGNNDRASRRAEDRIRERMDRETAKQIADANADFDRRYVNPLTKYDAYPADLRFSSTADGVHVVGVQAMGALLSTADDPPARPAGKALTNRVHQSFLNNTALAMYGGRTVAEEEFRQEMTDMLGNAPTRFKRTNQGPPWTIRFAAAAPISVQFNDGSLILSLRGESFKSGKSRAQEVPMNITAAYSIAKDAKGPKYVRQGDLQVLPPDVVAMFDKDGDGWLNRDEEQALNAGAKLTAGQSSLRGQLHDDFIDLFEAEVRPESRTLSGRWKSLGQLKPDYLAANPGWLTIGYIIDKEPAPAKPAGKDKNPGEKQPTEKSPPKS